MMKRDVPVYLITGFLESGKNPVSGFYHSSELFSDSGQNASDSL